MGWRSLIWVVRIVVLLFLLRLVWRFWAGVMRGLAGEPARGARPSRGKLVELERDPVCGTFVARQGAPRAMVDGRERYFCSHACRDRAQQTR